MRSLVLGSLALSAFLAGCSSRPAPEDVPGNGKPGAIADVDAQRAANGTAGVHPPSNMVVLPITDWPSPEIPVVNPPKVISIWFYPIKSSDGLSWRSGFWAYRVVKEFSWGMEDAFYQRSTPVSVAVDPATAGTPQAEEKMRAVAVQQSFVDGLRLTAQRLPGLPKPAPVTPTVPADAQAPIGSSGGASNGAAPTPAPAPAPRSELRPVSPPPTSSSEALGASPRNRATVPQDNSQPTFLVPR